MCREIFRLTAAIEKKIPTKPKLSGAMLVQASAVDVLMRKVLTAAKITLCALLMPGNLALL